MSQFLFSKGTGKLSGKRTYLSASPPARAVIVFYDGPNAMRLAGQVAEAKITTAAVPAGIAHPGNEGRPHTIISVLQRVDSPADIRLLRVIEEGKQDSGRDLSGDVLQAAAALFVWWSNGH